MPEKTVYIRFFGQVLEAPVKALIRAVEEKLAEGATKFVILISSTGGSVFFGMSAYNYLKGIPAEVVTHNFGRTNSVAVVLFCAGSTRLSVPHGVFLLHAVVSSFPQGAALEEAQLSERLNSLRLDTENIAGVIAANTGRTEKEVMDAIQDRTALNPEQAKEYGLVHEIRESLFEQGAEIISIETVTASP